MQRRRVVVTGIGVLCPLGSTLKESWKNLIESRCGITKLTGPEYETLPCKVAAFVKENGQKFDLSKHFTKSQLKSMAPATAYALLAANEALTDSNLLELSDEVKFKTGVAIGMGMVDLQDVCSTYEALKKGYHHVSPFFVPRILPNLAGGQISIKYGFKGPNHSVSTACATGAHAIGDSFRFIRDGCADIMVCGGTEACISPLSIAAFCRLRALCTNFNEDPTKSSRPFDKQRDGFVMGEGTAILVLQELDSALKHNSKIYAEVLGYGLSGDASHLTAPSPDGLGAFLAMERAVKDAQLDVSEVSYVNAHATSTPMGDAIEVKAIKKLFDNKTEGVAVSSTKGAHGHLLGAAGNLEAAFTVKAIEEGVLPPTLNLEESEDAGINFVPVRSQRWEARKRRRRIALKNAFGFGGTNASLCFAEYK
ncbi:3-oxoacyl-[acyl-carrier-protein] synthase, mitochondrial [Anthonomus grandis grandis]|uniref:3-oxoacyl-[acyl-carrier-protein] synthase, mitochondrial n=1 Tax=Anthonomus grandis grandis TaxID=2921223 RepID=UPI0021653CC7|nr:3-oxoacyl-[acyl-carrier-protein] synthase, mitochondrial [Anthonomus grandis grandis]